MILPENDAEFHRSCELVVRFARRVEYIKTCRMHGVSTYQLLDLGQNNAAACILHVCGKNRTGSCDQLHRQGSTRSPPPSCTITNLLGTGKVPQEATRQPSSKIPSTPGDTGCQLPKVPDTSRLRQVPHQSSRSYASITTLGAPGS